MSFVFSSTVNFGGLGDGFNSDRALFSFKEFMKSVGWTVPQSSDGATLNQDGNDVITNSEYNVSGGMGGKNNSSQSAWFVLRSPDGVREFLFCKPTGYSIADNYTRGKTSVIYSASQKFSTTLGMGGSSVSATNPPLAIDAIYISSSSNFATAPGVNFTKQSYYLNLGYITIPSGGAYYWKAYFGANNQAPYDWYYLIIYQSNSGYENRMSLQCFEGTDLSSEYVFTFNDLIGLPTTTNNRVGWVSKPSSFTDRTNLIDSLNSQVCFFRNDIRVSGYSVQALYSLPTNSSIMNINNNSSKNIVIPCYYQFGDDYYHPKMYLGKGNIMKMCLTYVNPFSLLTVNSFGDYLHLENGFCIPWNGSFVPC